MFAVSQSEPPIHYLCAMKNLYLCYATCSQYQKIFVNLQSKRNIERFKTESKTLHI